MGKDFETSEAGKQALYCLLAANTGDNFTYALPHVAQGIVAEFGLTEDDVAEVVALFDSPSFFLEDEDKETEL